MAGVPLPAMLIFTNQFAAMIQSQLPLVEVLDNLGKETPQRALKEVVEDIVEDVNHGVDLGDAMERHPDVFSDIYVNVVRAGMGSGRLDDALMHLSNYLENADTVSKKVSSALAYPIFVLVAFFAAFNGMIFFILPNFQRMFTSFDKELPAATQALITIGDFWQAYWYLIISTIAILGFSFVTWIATPIGRRQWDELKLGIPIIGPLWRMGSLARFLRTFAVQVRNEVNILQALELAAPSSGNRYVEDIIYNIADDIERGLGIAQAFRDHDVFSGIVLQMIASGEEAGSLDELLLSAADYFDRLLDNEVNRWTSLINPVLTIFMGISISGMMMAIFLPVFEMGGSFS